jgi:hypothetical protein
MKVLLYDYGYSGCGTGEMLAESSFSGAEVLFSGLGTGELSSDVPV